MELEAFANNKALDGALKQVKLIAPETPTIFFSGQRDNWTNKIVRKGLSHVMDTALFNQSDSVFFYVNGWFFVPLCKLIVEIPAISKNWLAHSEYS
jgi:hypothetical protein